MAIESKFLTDVLTYLTETVGGDWLLTGGSLVRLEFDDTRSTEDIDLAHFVSAAAQSIPTKESALSQLYRWLIQQGSGPEWVNLAVEAFLNEVPNWRTHVVEMKRGSQGAVFRPTLTLFVYLKLRRGTPIDLDDIRAAAKKCPESFDLALLRSWGNARVNEKVASLKGELKF